MTVKISLLTIESDNADPEIMATISALLERAGVHGAVVVAQANTETKAPPAETPTPSRETKRARARCPLFPPCKPCRDDEGVCLARAKREPISPPVPAKTEPVIDGEFPEVDEEPAAPKMPAVVERPLRVRVPKDEPVPTADPTGRVDGYPAPAPVAGSLQERIRDAVNAAPGVTIPNLAVSLLGSGSQESKRKIDFQAGGLVMSGELMRLNGGLYPKGYRGPTVKAAPATSARPAAAASNERYYQQILAAYARDNNTPQRELADSLFGESVGHTVAKLQIMLRQLVASERLERLGQGSYRPIGDSERRGRGEDDQDDADEDTESNGVSDDVEELDLS